MKPWIPFDFLLFRELEEDYKTVHLPQVKESLTKWQEEFDSEWIKERRMEYLENEEKKLSEELKQKYQIYEELIELDAPYWFRSLFVPEEQIKKLKKTSFQKRFLEFGESQNGVTSEMIAKARDFPFDQLIEVKRNNMAKCPFHEDVRPSFYVKNNYGYCFSCGKSWDTIAFLMEKDHFSFIDAVSKLAG